MRFTTKKHLTIALKNVTVEFKDGVYDSPSTLIDKRLKAHPFFGKYFFAVEEAPQPKKKVTEG